MSASSERNRNGQALDDERVTTRTTASDGRSCQRCGGDIRGRRRNGFCSDRCRMATNRKEDAARRRVLVSRLREVVEEVEAEWFPRRDASADE